MTDFSDKKNLFGVELEINPHDDLGRRYHKDWVEQTALLENKVGKQIVVPQSANFIGNIFTFSKYRGLILAIILIIAILLLEIFYIQIIKGDQYYRAAEGNRQRLLPIAAERGLIFDRNGVILTKNIPSFSLTIIPQNLPHKQSEQDEIVKRLAQLTNQEEAVVHKILEEYKDYSFESIIIKENLDYDTALKIQLEAPNLPGIQIQRSSKRLYLSDSNLSSKNIVTSTPFSLAHVLGYESKLNKQELAEFHPLGYLPSDYIGKTGVEKTYEKTLRGIYGRKRIEVDSQGKEQSVLAEEAPTPGEHIKLAIDVKMQNRLEAIFNSYLRNNDKFKASGVVMNPNNGEILALVSLPTFDDNDFSGGISEQRYSTYLNDKNKPLFNRAISGRYPSGSSIKPAIAIGALQAGIITPATSFLSSGGLQVGQWFFPDWLAGGHGITNVRKALAWSVNTFFYYLGGGYGNFTGLGVEKMMQYLREFGFGTKLDIDLPAEEDGFLPSKEWKENTLHEKWYVGDTYNLSIGQGNLLVTPLQIAVMTATIANGGKVYWPHVVYSIIDSVNKNEKVIDSKVMNSNFMSPENIETVRLGMKDCVEYGSCHRLSQLPFSLAGKTGTAQWNSNKANHAWFTSFAPFDKPEIVVVIIVEEGGEGSNISASIAYDFYKWWWVYKSGLIRN